jgi:thioredoxin reductase
MRAAYDVVVIGGGPAGLSAALMLARCRRRVLVCDAGNPRNAAARGVHGYLTRDGIAPADLLRLAREELHRYAVDQRAATVTAVERDGADFTVTLAGDERLTTASVLIATGVRDQPPAIDGIDACYGISVHHCPYCDGWERRDQRIAVVGERVSPAGLALALKTWSDRIIVATHGRARLTAAQRRRLNELAIPIYTSRIARLDHDDGRLRRLVFETGDTVECDALFFTAGQRQQCDLAMRLGCEFNRRGTVKTDHLGQTCVPGVYVVGDASRDVQFVVVAAAEGAKAGVAINRSLQERAGLVAADAAAELAVAR